MCAATGKPPAFVCTVGELKVGQEFHTPDGETWMVISTYGIPSLTTDVMVVNLGNARGGYNRYGRNGDELKGQISLYHGDVKLGHDHKGRLYASTYLNNWYDPTPTPEEQESIQNLLDLSM